VTSSPFIAVSAASIQKQYSRCCFLSRRIVVRRPLVLRRRGGGVVVVRGVASVHGEIVPLRRRRLWFISCFMWKSTNRV